MIMRVQVPSLAPTSTLLRDFIMTDYHSSYFTILIFFSVSVLIALALIAVSRVLSKILSISSPNVSKNSSFECGFNEFEDARVKFDIRFYLIAILFLIFDLEMSFLLPWGILLHEHTYVSGIGISTSAFFAMIIFLFILFIGFIYEWKKGALEWK